MNATRFHPELTAAWTAATDGDSVDGTIRHNGTYVAYQTIATGSKGNRYFKVQIGSDDGPLEQPLSPTANAAVATVLDLTGSMPLPRKGEFQASTKL